MFAFLSDVQPTNRNQIIDEIGEKMDELVEDLDVEVGYCYLKQDIVIINTLLHLDGKNNDFIL